MALFCILWFTFSQSACYNTFSLFDVKSGLSGVPVFEGIAYVKNLLYLRTLFRPNAHMNTNPHILAIDRYLGQVRECVCALPDSDEKERINNLLHAIIDEIFSAQTDFSALHNQIADLNQQLFEPIVHAQMGQQCRYIDIDALNKGAYTLEQFEKMLYQACESEAKVLGAFLIKYAKIGYLDFHGENKKKIFMHLHEFCPTMRSYKYSNFVANF